MHSTNMEYTYVDMNDYIYVHVPVGVHVCVRPSLCVSVFVPVCKRARTRSCLMITLALIHKCTHTNSHERIYTSTYRNVHLHMSSSPALPHENLIVDHIRQYSLFLSTKSTDNSLIASRLAKMYTVGLKRNRVIGKQTPSQSGTYQLYNWK